MAEIGEDWAWELALKIGGLVVGGLMFLCALAKAADSVFATKKEVTALGDKHDFQMETVREVYNTWYKENREDHQRINDKLDKVIEMIK